MGILGESMTFDVQGMSCGHCEAKVEKAVGAVSGVQKVKADAASGTVQVTVSRQSGPERGTLEQAIADAGYTVVR